MQRKQMLADQQLKGSTYENPKLVRRQSALRLRHVTLSDAWAIVRRHTEVYLRLWKLELAAPLIEPFGMVLAFGWGVGSLVAARVGDLPYLEFVGAGVLAYSALLRALFECTYASYFRMVYQSTFDAILATPIEVESLAFAEIAWATIKASIDAVIILFILTLFGVVTSPFALLVPLPLVCGGLFTAALSLGVTAHIRDIDVYNLYIAIFFSIIFLCGVWFPIDVLPTPLQIVAWAIPITSAIDLARATMSGIFLTRHILEILYLSVAAFLTIEWALRQLRGRMVV